MKLWIAADRINHHVAIQGASGVGKSQIVRQLCRQALERGWPIVALDVKCELIREFWREGDWVLNPADLRCPRLALEEEATNEMQGMAMAYSAFPDEPRDQPFFKKHPRAILARLLGVNRPTTEELARWLADESQIDMRLHGTDLAKSLSRDGGEMRAGMIATLSELGRSLRLWPNAEEQPRSFSVRRWARERKGSIFLTSTPDTLDALRPVQSMLLDMLILAMQSVPGPGMLALDEVAQLQRIQKLETAMSLQRSADNPILLPFQEISQLEAHYGKLARAIASQPYTQFVFRTSEEESARHAAGVLGRREVERIRESRGAHFWSRRQHSYSTERVENYCVTPGQVQCLEDLHAYMGQAGNVTPVWLRYRPVPDDAPGLLPREIKIVPPVETPKPAKPRYTQPRLPLTAEPA